jgi:hypothetical protein
MMPLWSRPFSSFLDSGVYTSFSQRYLYGIHMEICILHYNYPLQITYQK